MNGCLSEFVPGGFISDPSREAIATCFDTLLDEGEPDPRNKRNLERRPAEYLVKFISSCEVINGAKFLEANLGCPPKGIEQVRRYNLNETDMFFLHHIQLHIRNVLALAKQQRHR